MRTKKGMTSGLLRTAGHITRHAGKPLPFMCSTNSHPSVGGAGVALAADAVATLASSFFASDAIQ